MINGKKLAYVIGAGGHAKVAIRALQDLGYAVAAVFDDDSRKWGTSLLGAPVVGPLDELDVRRKLPTVLAVGDNRVRRTLAQRFELDWLTVVHPSAFVDRTARLGGGTVVFAGAVIQADATVGNHAIINTSASLDHDCVIENYVHVAPGARLAGGVCVQEGALLGAGVVVIPGRRIGAWTTVGAGGTVVNDLPGSVTAVGVPAQVRGARGPQHADVRKAAPLSKPNADQQIVAETVGGRDSDPVVRRFPKRIYLSPPHMSMHERELLLEAFDSNWIAPLGPQVDAFENDFAQKLGVGEAVAVVSGTAALHLALLLLGVGPGDEVATSTLTFAASANAICYVGASPVFIDSETRTWNLDPDLLAEELESGVRRGRPIKAVLAVDISGQCADYEPILKTCRFYDVPLIEDAAEALGATHRGAAAGTFGDIGCFSFNGNKIITTSGGGMLATRRHDLAEKARFLAAQARDSAPHYEHSQIGYNYRMSNLLAAVGRGQLRVLDERVEARRANFRYYQQSLEDLPGIEFMPEHPQGRATRWLTCILVDPERFGATRDDLRLVLEKENIESRPVWKPMHLQPVFSSSRVRGGAVAERLFETGLCLPSGSNLTEDDLWRIVQVIRGVPTRPSTPVPPQTTLAGIETSI